MFLVTVYKMKETLEIKDVRELAQAAEVLGKQLAPAAPAPDKFTHYVTDDGSSGVIMVETDQPASNWVDRIKQGLANWIVFDKTEQMESFKLANFKFGTGTGPRDRGRG